ncbi:MAG: spore coat U domain-containing protein [Geminicoccaceae bacterium]
MAALPVAAAQDTGTLGVTATVASNCAVAGGTLNFGTYTSGQNADLDAQTTISYTNCAGTLTFELDGGASQDEAARTMVSGTNALNYQLFRDSGYSQIFGSGGNSYELQLFVPFSGEIDVFGRIPGGQAVPIGDYADTVTITLTF